MRSPETTSEAIRRRRGSPASACVVALLIIAAVAAIAAPAPARDSSLVLRFHIRTARCDVAGTSRPLAMKLVCG